MNDSVSGSVFSLRRWALCIRTVGALALASLWAVSACAQGGPEIDGKMAEDVYKNIHALNGTPANQVLPAMRLFEVSLGVTCNYCHVEEDRTKDDKANKQTARNMIAMVREINRGQFGGRQQVTCYTCHRGSPEPVLVPDLNTVKISVDQEGEEIPGPALPTIDQILEKFVTAMGGEAAIRKVTSRVVTGTQNIPTGVGGRVPVDAQVEVLRKAPNKAVIMFKTAKFAVADGFDGMTAWTLNPRGISGSPSALEAMRAKRAADLYETLDLKKEYSRLTVRGIQKVGDRDAYEVIGTLAGERPERLFFDSQSGFLIRKITVQPTQAGDDPFQIDFDDYRDTGNGVMYPYLMRMLPATPNAVIAARSTLRVTKVDNNVELDDARFAKPASKEPPAR